MRIFVDGKAVKDISTVLVRADVKAKNVTGPHGFDVTLSVQPGNHTVTVVPLQTGTSTAPPTRLRAVTVTIAIPAE